MRKIFSVSLLVILISLVSCNGDNMGYPSSVNFPKNGGSMIIKGDEQFTQFHSIEILDYDGDGNSSWTEEGSDSMIVSYQWLTAKARISENKIELIAEPTTSQKKRTLYLYVISGGVDFDSDIKVTQK